VEAEIEALRAEYSTVRSKSGQAVPVYAALTQPQPLTSQTFSNSWMENTLLLEYSLGEERSYLWQ